MRSTEQIRRRTRAELRAARAALVASVLDYATHASVPRECLAIEIRKLRDEALESLLRVLSETYERGRAEGVRIREESKE